MRYRSQAAIGEKGGEIEGEGGKMQGDCESSETYGKGEELQRAVSQEQRKVGAAEGRSSRRWEQRQAQVVEYGCYSPTNRPA